jgi:hypothetical protein
MWFGVAGHAKLDQAAVMTSSTGASFPQHLLTFLPNPSTFLVAIFARNYGNFHHDVLHRLR